MKQQTDIVDRLEPGSRVVVLRIRSLGDCVLSTPAIHLLKSYRPDLEIGVVVEPRFAAVFENHPDVSALLEPKACAVRGYGAALCLNLHGGTRSARLTLLSGARFRAGLDIFRPQWAYNTPVPTAQEILGTPRRVHTAEHMAATMFYLGVPVRDVPRASLSPDPGRSPLAPDRPFAVFHAVASAPEKTWPAPFFIDLATYGRERFALEPVFIFGPDDDASPFHMWHTLSGSPLGDVIRLMRDASLFIGNDSGPAHVAASFGVPQLVLFGPSDVEIWKPWQAPHLVLQAKPMGRISVDEAARAVDRLCMEQEEYALRHRRESSPVGDFQ